MNGTLVLIAARWATPAKSITSCTDDVASIAKPVWRQAITSWWSPKIDNAWAAKLLAETCITPGNNSPAILYILGIFNNNPWLAVNVVVRAPVCNDPWTDPAAPASDCISTIFTGIPNRFFLPLDAHSSAYSAIGDDGVIG